MSIVRFSVRNPVLVNMLMLLIVFVGGVLALTTVREMFPEARPKKLLVTTVYPGVAPAELEKSVTIKVEEAVRDVEGVEKVDSSISEGVSATTLTLRSDVKDVDLLLQEVKAEVDAIEDLPVDAEKTTVRKMEPKLPVISVALYGMGDEAARKRAARWLRDELLLLPGVSEINVNGQREDEIAVEVRPEKLLEYDITFDEIATAIRDTNLDLSGGQLEGDRSVLSVRTLGESQRGVDLEKLAVRSLPDGRTIRLSDVAVVRDEFRDTKLEGYFNSEPTTSLVIYKTMTQDAIDISSLIKAYIKGKQGEPFDPYGRQAAWNQPWYSRPFAVVWAEAGRSISLALGKPNPETVYEKSRATPFPHDFKLALHTDIARFVEGRIELMVNNGVQGLFLILVSLVLFLNWRVAFWAAAGLPVTFLGTFVLLWSFDVTLNLVSLMGLIIVLSIDVDEAIVMAENVYRHIEEGLSPHEAAIRGAEEMMWPIIVMTGTTIGAFVPLLFLQGQLGDFFRVLPLVCVAAMTMSMIEALVILPSHLSELPDMRKKPVKALFAAKRLGPIRKLRDGFLKAYRGFLTFLVDELYDRFIRLSMKWRYVTLATAISSLSLSIGLVAGDVVRASWFPKMDGETLVASLELPVGTPASVTRERLQKLSDLAITLPEVINAQMFVARQYDLGGEGMEGTRDKSHLGQLIIELKESVNRTRHSEEVLVDLRKASESLTGVNAVTWESLNGGPAGRSLELKVSGEDFASVLEVSDLLKAKLATFQGVFDLDDNLDRGQREVRVKPRESARATGITTSILANEVRNAFFGREARRIARNREDVKVMVRYPEEFRRDVHNVERMWIPAPRPAEADGAATGPSRDVTHARPRHNWVPFGEVAELTEDQSFSTLNRTNQQRAITVFGDVDETVGDEQAILKAVAEWYAAEIAPKYPSTRYEPLGKSLEIQKMLSGMVIAFPVSILIIYILLAALFRSYVQPLVVMIAIPFGIQGAIIGHWFMGYDITILSMIGLIALNGIVDNDSLVLVDFINSRVRAGLSLYEASVEGSKLRLRAIVLTTVTTTFGIMPLMLETSFQAKFLIPMAITLTFGLMFATVLTLVVVPAINMVLADMAALWRWIWNGDETPDASEEDEPFAPHEPMEPREFAREAAVS
jgi:hydrophobic/amphiphilic exporter-1 (mainly G- bacteria), HAE1 family